MFRKLAIATTTAAIMVATAPAFADTLTDCICKIHIKVDGKTYNLRPADKDGNGDFKVERSPYGQVRVVPKKRINEDPRWAHAAAEIKVCINGTKVADAKKK